MSCILEFPESSITAYFCNKKDKQNILIDILTKHGDVDINTLASVLRVSVEKLNAVYHKNDSLTENQADGLAQLFLLFLAKNFFCKCRVIQNYSQ
jgi:hypothetical protein